jgi:hypothetical protein
MARRLAPPSGPPPYRCCWLGAADRAHAWLPDGREPLPLVALEAPYLMQTIACERLDMQGLA